MKDIFGWLGQGRGRAFGPKWPNGTFLEIPIPHRKEGNKSTEKM